MDKTGLEVCNLNVAFQDANHTLQALDDVCFRVPSGSILAILGESGSGKTTTAKAIMGILPENAEVAGSILINDQRMDNLPETQRRQLQWSRVALVFQNGPETLNPVIPIIDQVAEPLIRHKNLPKAQARKQALSSMQDLGLSEKEVWRYCHQLSGGQIQRALFAMAQILDPPVLLLDEPTAALDSATRFLIAKKIMQAKHAGKTVVLITHDLDLAAATADMVTILYLGQVIETLPAKDLLENARHPYTKALVRSYPGPTTIKDLGGVRGDPLFRVIHRHKQGQNAHSHVVGTGLVHQTDHAPVTGCLFAPRCTQKKPVCEQKDVGLTPTANGNIRCALGGITTTLAVNRIAKTYGNKHAVHPTDFSIDSGEVFCLVGETGSGKTTLAMMCAGAITPSEGKRFFLGKQVTKQSKSVARKIGVIYQDPAQSVSHRLSIRDIIAEPLFIHGMGKDKNRVKQEVKKVLDAVKLPQDSVFLSRYPHELNMGTIQRVCMARALILRPCFLVADEPTSALDPSSQAKVMKMLLDLQIEFGLSMLFVTHDLGLARKVADKVGVMHQGRVVEAGSAAKVFEAPQNEHTRNLIDNVIFAL